MRLSLHFAPQGLRLCPFLSQLREEARLVQLLQCSEQGQAKRRETEKQPCALASCLSSMFLLIHGHRYGFSDFLVHAGHVHAFWPLPEIDPMSLGPSNKFLQEIQLPGKGNVLRAGQISPRIDRIQEHFCG